MSWNDTPEYVPFAAWESANYPVILKSYELKTTKPEKGSKLMFQAQFECEENDHPALQNYIGRSITDWFVVGSDDDPGVDDSDTLNTGKSIGVQKIKALAKAAEVTPDDPDGEITMDVLTEVLDGVIGTSIVAIVKKRGQGSNAQHNINGYVAVGEVQIGPTDTNDKKDKKTNKPSKPSSMGPSVQSAVNAAKAAKKAKAVEVIIEEEEEEAALPPPKTAKKAGKVAPKVGKAQITCPACKDAFPYDKLQEHLDVCVGAEEAEEAASDDDDE